MQALKLQDACLRLGIRITWTAQASPDPKSKQFFARSRLQIIHWPNTLTKSFMQVTTSRIMKFISNPHETDSAARFLINDRINFINSL